MRRASVLTILALNLALHLACHAAFAAPKPGQPPWLAGPLVREKQQIPDDPLAGLAPEGSGERGRGKSPAKAACAITPSPADNHDIGDLRATLAFVKHGPKAWPCSAKGTASAIRLRIAVNDAGKITAVESTTGDSGLASAMGKWLSGKAIAPRPDGATLGVVVLTLSGTK